MAEYHNTPTQSVLGMITSWVFLTISVVGVIPFLKIAASIYTIRKNKK